MAVMHAGNKAARQDNHSLPCLFCQIIAEHEIETPLMQLLL
jgi:hypothetical protein